MATALAQLNRVHAGQQAYATIIAAMPQCAAKSRFVCGLPVGALSGTRLVGFLCATRSPGDSHADDRRTWHYAVGG
jgi:hypothetical protein